MNNEMLSAFPSPEPPKMNYPINRLNKPAIGDLTIDELTRSNKELEQFAFIAAHDLQEPLIVAYSYTQLLDRKFKGKLDNDADELISSILESTQRMQKLIQNLLRYSRLGQGNIQRKELDCNIVFNQAIENLKVNIEKNSVQIRCGILPVIKGDEIQLTQLFQNLINNAIKFRKQEGIASIDISAEEKDNAWLFSIQDNGIGIAPGNTENVFNLYQRLHNQSEYEGSGIGLTLCKRVVEAHQGKIWIDSELGKGSTVYFTIPKYRL